MDITVNDALTEVECEFKALMNLISVVKKELNEKELEYENIYIKQRETVYLDAFINHYPKIADSLMKEKGITRNKDYTMEKDSLRKEIENYQRAFRHIRDDLETLYNKESINVRDSIRSDALELLE